MMAGYGDGLPYDEVLPPFGEDGLSDHDLAFQMAEFEADAQDQTLDADKRWRISSEDQAEWAARKYLLATAERERLVAQRAKWVAQIDAWYDSASKDASRSIDYFRYHLMDYAIRSRTKARKTVQLPSLKLRTIEHPARVAVDNEDDFVEWAVTNDETAVRVRTEVEKTVLQNYMWKVVDGVPKVIHPETGEIVPGLTVKDSFVSVSFT